MKTLKCKNCNRNQKEGKFCLDCGGELKEIVTDEVKFKKIETKRTAEQLKRDVRNWLTRIGVQQPDIKINLAEECARVEYTINRIVYNFSSMLQRNASNNLAAIEQFLHYRVLGIERGIETTEQAFAGYEALPDYSNGKIEDPYLVFGFREKVSIEEIRKKYKILAKRYHPDVNPDEKSQKEFLLVQKALKIIEDSQ